MDFVEFPKIPRWSKEVIVTEKIDGTNSQITVSDDGLSIVSCGSRNRFLTPGKTTDNFGFAAWVEANKEELLKLGPGTHYGEWWGSGIQRGYGLKEKRFSLFNTSRWSEVRPACCHVVPVLWSGNMDDLVVDAEMEILKGTGSKASPGFMYPEGIVIFHVAGKYLFKKTFKDEHKGT